MAMTDGPSILLASDARSAWLLVLHKTGVAFHYSIEVSGRQVRL